VLDPDEDPDVDVLLGVEEEEGMAVMIEFVSEVLHRSLDVRVSHLSNR
jgi:hypothetical protein